MNRRFRLVSALLALAAFSASLAEGVRASAACGTMASATGGPMAGHDMAAMAPLAPATAAGDAAVAPGPETSSGRIPDCPLASAAGGCSALSFAAAPPSVEFGSPVQAPPAAARDVSPDLLLATSLLRPPRA